MSHLQKMDDETRKLDELRQQLDTQNVIWGEEPTTFGMNGAGRGGGGGRGVGGGASTNGYYDGGGGPGGGRGGRGGGELAG
jgi:hypothetical protein